MADDDEGDDNDIQMIAMTRNGDMDVNKYTFELSAYSDSYVQ